MDDETGHFSRTESDCGQTSEVRSFVDLRSWLDLKPQTVSSLGLIRCSDHVRNPCPVSSEKCVIGGHDDLFENAILVLAFRMESESHCRSEKDRQWSVVRRILTGKEYQDIPI